MISQIEAWVAQEPRVLDWAALNLPDIMPGAERLRKSIAEGFHADMQWLADTLELRIHPRTVRSCAQSAVLFLWSYPQPLRKLDDSAEVNIAAFAQGEDYHRTLSIWIKDVVNQLIVADPTLEVQGFVDAFPVMERELAVLAGLGWIGKNSLLLHRKHGSAFVIGGFLCNREVIKPSLHTPRQEFCGTCRRCIDACPSAAITDERSVDARKCTSYLTIEKRGEFSDQESQNLSGWIFGCDICQVVCPWNARTLAETATPFWPTTMNEWDHLLQPGNGLRAKLKGTALDRAGRKGLARNFQTLCVQKKTSENPRSNIINQ